MITHLVPQRLLLRLQLSQLRRDPLPLLRQRRQVRRLGRGLGAAPLRRRLHDKQQLQRGWAHLHHALLLLVGFRLLRQPQV